MDINDLVLKVDSLVLTNDSLIKSNAAQTAEIKLIKEALLGSEYTMGKGMIEVQQDHADRIMKLEAIRNVDHEIRLAKIEKAILWIRALAWALSCLIGLGIAKWLLDSVNAYFKITK